MTPSTQIENLPVETLVPYARNSRTHSDEQVAQIMASIREFGFCNPVLIDADGGIIAGHGRVMAATRMKLETVPCLRLSHLTEAQKRAYVIADNRIALSGAWDEEMLSLEVQELHSEDFDVGVLGFDVPELEKLMDLEEGESDEDTEEIDAEAQVDKLDELQRQWGTKSGQLWSLGEHRVLCGDSTKSEDVSRLMAGKNVALCFTSPPYGQQREYTKEGKEKVSDWLGLMQGVFNHLPMNPDGQVLVNLGLIHRDNEWVPYWDPWIESMRDGGWRRFGLYVWDQGFGLPGNWNGRFAPSHELIFHFNKKSIEPQKFIEKKPENIKARSKGGSTMRNAKGECVDFTSPESSAQPTKIPDSVVRVNRMHGGHNIDHPAIFPTQLPSFAMQCWPGDVYEPFCGSGTTLIAAEQLNRKCYGMEISPAYVAVILQRFQDATGKTPVLVNDG